MEKGRHGGDPFTGAKTQSREPEEQRWSLGSGKVEVLLQQWQTIGLKNRTCVLLLDLPSAFQAALDQAKGHLSPSFNPASPFIMTFAHYPLVT